MAWDLLFYQSEQRSIELDEGVSTCDQQVMKKTKASPPVTYR
jgi:hypothetical protein